MEYTKEVKIEFVERTVQLIKNSCDSQLNVTMSVNLVLGLILLPREELKGSGSSTRLKSLINKINLEEYAKINIVRIKSTHLCTSDMLIMIRNGIAHGDIKMAATPDHKEIEGIVILGSKNNYNDKIEFEFSVDNFREFSIQIANTYLYLLK